MRLRVKRHDARRKVRGGASGWALCSEDIPIDSTSDGFSLMHDDASRLFRIFQRISIQLHLNLIRLNLSKVDLHFEVPMVVDAGDLEGAEPDSSPTFPYPRMPFFQLDGQFASIVDPTSQ